MKIRPVGAELLHTDGRTDGHDEASSGFSQILRKRLKMYSVLNQDYSTLIHNSYMHK
jgi:hypothetical protein